MGDCWIKIVFSSDLLVHVDGKKKEESNESNKGWVSTTTTTTTTSSKQKYSSDTTIREVVQSNDILWSLFTSSSANQKFKLWDCTVHPPKDISSWPIIDYPELTGPQSKTLHDAGCFPSATWFVLPFGIHPSQFSIADYDDVQYNNTKRTKTNNEADDGAAGNTTTLLEFATTTDDSSSSSVANKTSRPLPSDVMGSVTKRFEKEEENEGHNTIENKIQLRIQNQAQQRQKEIDRAKKLDERIRKLEETNTKDKNKNVSNQVRKMLVKSRAIGDKNLKMQDRTYFECMLDIDDDDDDDTDGSSSLTRHFVYFSLQATFASIATFFASYRTKQQQESCVNSEVIIKRRNNEDRHVDDDTPYYYRRFPVTMRVYEAIENKYLTSYDQVDTIVIRWYPDGHTSTPSILDDENYDTALPKKNDDGIAMDSSSVTKPSSVDESAAAGQTTDNGDRDGVTVIEDMGLRKAILVMEEASAKKGTKKQKKKTLSASAMKVRNMQMKAKANGDKKRIPKVDDRFFLEVVLVDNTGRAISADPYFLARTDSIQRLLSTVSGIEKDPTNNNKECEFLIPQQEQQQTAEDQNSHQYRVVHDTMMILKDAEAAGILNCFDRIILRPKDNK